MAERKAKDWFDKDLAHLLANKLTPLYADFDTETFVEQIDKGVGKLEIKARLAFIAKRLKTQLPDNYPEAAAILVQSLGEENPSETGMFTNFYWVMPYATFVELYGLDHLDASLEAIAEITKRNTGEFAIRPYLETFPDETFSRMLEWSQDDNFHLRRLASEGSRPRLPWAKKLNVVVENPDLALPILENLKDDPIKFVQKSVANHINDMLKDNYDLAMNLLKTWHKDAGKERRWIIKHALRKELKKGNPEAEALIR